MILLTGHGVQLTVLPLLGVELGWSTRLISYTGSAYFMGFILGCLTVPKLVATVGHIRVFAVLTSTATAALLLLPLLPHLPAWVVARLVTGWSIAGLYMVIESWLNDRTGPENRGVVLSIYTVLTLVSISFGQLTIGLDLSYTQLVSVGAILLAMGAIPVGLTRSAVPSPIPSAHFRLREVYSASHVAVIGAAVGGLTTASYWVLGPIVAEKMGLTAGDQVPLLYAAMFLYGATTFPLYSISLAHANDNTSLSLIEVGSVILMVHSAGAVVGPILTSLVMDLSRYGMFVFSGSILLLFGVWSYWRARTHPIAREFFEPFPDTPRTSHEVFEVADASGDETTDPRPEA